MNQFEPFSQFRRPRGVLSCIPEHRIIPSVPEVRLECDEIIDSWDEIDAINTSIYSTNHDEKVRSEVPSHLAYLDGSDQFSHQHKPPHYQASEDESPLSNIFVDSLLQLWRDTNEYPSTHVITSDTEYQGSQSDSVIFSDSSQLSSASNNIFSPGLDQTTPELAEVSENNIESLIQDQGPNVSQIPGSELVDCATTATVTEMPAPLSQSSSRSSSPAEIEGLSQSVLRLSFDNLRSISPRIERSPSPISSRSSSPRFLRSPSPFQVLSSSFLGAQMDDSTDALVFYDDRYIYRSVSPRNQSFEHRVPDIDADYQLDVSMSEEFLSFSNRQRRYQNSCGDQVVPEFIEE